MSLSDRRPHDPARASTDDPATVSSGVLACSTVSSSVLACSPVADAAKARALVYTLVEERSATCANILPDMTAIYWWDGRVCDSAEAVLLLKTTAALAEPLVKRQASLHDHQVPCAIVLPLAGGHPPFLEWIAAQTALPPTAATES